MTYQVFLNFKTTILGKFKIYLDRRGNRDKPDSYKFNLTVRVCHGGDTLYLNVSKMTYQQYKHVFIKERTDKESIEFRETCNSYITKCERIFETQKTYDRKKFRELFYKKEDDRGTSNITSLKLKDLFENYVSNYSEIGIKSKNHYRFTLRTLEKYTPDLTVSDITVDFLRTFERCQLNKGISRSTVEGFISNLRRIINFYTYNKKVIPKSYEYPFGKGGYSIGCTFSTKIILKEEEIRKLIEWDDFDSSDQKFARDIWLFLYRCNGINFCDLLRLRWSNIKGDYLIFYRKKTEKTRKNNLKPVISPLTEKLKEIIDRIGVKDSPFILGQLPEGYSDVYFFNKSEKLKKKYNYHLKVLNKKLNLSVKLNLSTARSTYATTLLRNGVSKDTIGEMLVHGDSRVTEHYLGSMDHEKTFLINQHVL